MELIVKKDEFSTAIEDIDIGEGFVYNNNYFIKISDDGDIALDDEKQCLAVLLVKGYPVLHVFESYTKVKPVKNIKIIIEE